jgi:hypothetical protein
VLPVPAPAAVAAMPSLCCGVMGWKPARVRLASSVRSLAAASKPRLNSCVLINGGAPARRKKYFGKCFFIDKRFFLLKNHFFWPDPDPDP